MPYTAAASYARPIVEFNRSDKGLPQIFPSRVPTMRLNDRFIFRLPAQKTFNKPKRPDPC
jgi:hypothetical protein